MNFEIDASIQGALEALRERGRNEARPIGLEADRLGRPIPVDDPYFEMLIARGEGRVYVKVGRSDDAFVIRATADSLEPAFMTVSPLR